MVASQLAKVAKVAKQTKLPLGIRLAMLGSAVAWQGEWRSDCITLRWLTNPPRSAVRVSAAEIHKEDFESLEREIH